MIQPDLLFDEMAGLNIEGGVSVAMRTCTDPVSSHIPNHLEGPNTVPARKGQQKSHPAAI